MMPAGEPLNARAPDALSLPLPPDTPESGTACRDDLL
jgi:hypothetical protein